MSVYRVTEVIGTSTESWEHAARSAVETAAATVREIRVAEVTRQDVTIENWPGYQLPGPSGDLVQLRIRSLSQRQAPQTRFRHLHFQEGAAAVPLNEA